MKLDPAALEKRIKRQIRARKHRFYAIVPPGFEETACRELADCGIPATSEDRGGVAFSGDWETCWKAHHRARIPARILVRLTHFTAMRFDQFERQIEVFPWELWLRPRQPVVFQIEARQSALYHEGVLQERFARCVAQRLQPWQTIVPEAASAPNVQTIYLRNVDNRMTVSLDCSGELLYKRGYAKHVAVAPLRDNLAAAILREADFAAFTTLIDPMAGSGTFGLEALLGLSEIGAGHLRHFAFEQFPVFSPAAYRHFLKTNANPRPEPAKLRTIVLRDRHERPLSIMRHNLHQLTAAGVNAEHVIVEQADFFDTRAEALSGNILLVLNPPYGTRLPHAQNTRAFFGKLGEHLRRQWRGCAFAIIAPGQEAERALALSVSRKIVFSNGGISAALLLGHLR